MSDTRTRILNCAEEGVLAKGFEATSIEEIVAATGITKSGFFYHFKDKNALAHALLERYIASDDALFDQIESRAKALTDDPLQAFLVGLKMLVEVFEDLPNGHPGCLIASAAYQERLFDREVVAMNRAAMLRWRARFLGTLEEISEIYPPNDQVSMEDLADMLTTIIEGGIVLAKAIGDPKVTARQVILFRSYIKILFQPQHH